MDDRQIFSSTRHNASDLSRSTFATVRKGFDPAEVRRYLESVGREMAALESKIRELQDQLAEANRLAANPVIDESMLTAALGNQSAIILRTAHEEAGRVTADAQQRATAVFAQAQERAAAFTVEAQERAISIVTEAENSAVAIDQEARAASTRLVESAKANSESLVDRAREQGRAIVEQAQEARRSILNDLAVKRKALTLQIDQLRAARDFLATAVGSVRESVDQVMGGLMSSDEGARAAAIEALRLQRPSIEPSHDELVADVPLREVPEPTLVSPDDITPAPITVTREVTTPRDEPTGDTPAIDRQTADAVEEIFAKLRQATKAEAPAPVAPAAPAKRRLRDSKSTTTTAVAARDDAMEAALGTLVRRIKRTLQDDQNITLELTRSLSEVSEEQLEDERQQRSRYVEAARDAISQAVDAGAAHAANSAGVSGSAPRPNDDMATDLALTIVLALRKKIVSGSTGEPADRVTAAFREWRGAKVERVCTDAIRRAFHYGIVTAAAGRDMTFVLSPDDAPCDACRRDAAGGVVTAGLPFPSGHLFPPLHAGCACTIAIA